MVNHIVQWTDDQEKIVLLSASGVLSKKSKPHLTLGPHLSALSFLGLIACGRGRTVLQGPLISLAFEIRGFRSSEVMKKRMWRQLRNRLRPSATWNHHAQGSLPYINQWKNRVKSHFIISSELDWFVAPLPAAAEHSRLNCKGTRNHSCGGLIRRPAELSKLELILARWIRWLGCSIFASDMHCTLDHIHAEWLCWFVTWAIYWSHASGDGS